MTKCFKPVLLLLVLVNSATAIAEVLNNNTPAIRIRLGDNAVGGINTVVYQAGIPNELMGVPGVVVDPTTVSANAIGGGSGVFRVRIVTDLNLRPPVSNSATSLTGEFTYDSSSPMVCMTAPTCGSTSIPFDRISWTARDSDTHALPLAYDGSSSQPAQTQIDTDPRNRFSRTRHRNYFRYQYDNDELLPAGTYEGDIFIEGEGITQ